MPNLSNSSKLRISIVEYLNTAPLIWGFTRGALQGKYALSFTVPSLCAEALRTGAADIAIIPAIEYQRIVSQGIELAILPDLSIASKQRVRSLLLVSKVPICEARKIVLDRGSRSTQALVRILCSGLWKIAPEITEAEPRLVAMLAEADAALLIGDPALRLALELHARPVVTGERGPDTVKLHSRISGVKLYVYDVVEEWRRMTGLPAVLAFWAGRREVVTPEVVADFLASRDEGLLNLPQICADAVRTMRLPKKDVRAYFEENIDYSLDAENLQGLRAFFEHSDSLGLIERLEPLRITARPAVPVDAAASAKPTRA